MIWRQKVGLAWLLLCVAALPAVILRAQDRAIARPAPPASQDPIQQTPQLNAAESTEPMHTLHVYMDLIQIPVLVLDSEQERMKPVDPSKFLVSLDAGPPFRPSHVRQQGEDPITLGILLDVNGAPEQMQPLDEAIAALSPRWLQSRDHVTLLAMNCGLFRTLRDAPAESAVLRDGVDRALQQWQSQRKEKHPAPCERRVHLWDAMSYAVAALANLPGRRVLLVVSSGVDGGSRTKWNELRQFAQRSGVAIFGYAPGQSAGFSTSSVSGGGGGGRRGGSSSPMIVAATGTELDPFNTVCQLSGGMVFHADPSYAGKRLIKFMTIVRERYILEFSRPRTDEPGEHNIEVTIPRGNPRAYIRPAGVSMLMRDAALDTDPTTIPRDATGAPELGKRKPLKPPTPDKHRRQ